MPNQLWSNGLTVTANEIRTASAVTMMYGGRAVGARGGIRPGGTAFAVSLAGSTITVQPGAMVLDPGWSSAQGPYWWAMTSSATHTLTAAGASTRLDVVVAEVLDSDENAGDGAKLARTRYIAGVAGSGTEPTLAQNQIRLCSISVPSAGSPTLTDRRPFTVASGGILPVADSATRDALPSPYVGQPVWNAATQTLDVYGSTGTTSWGAVTIGPPVTTTTGLIQASGWLTDWTAVKRYPFVNISVNCYRTGGNVGGDSGGNVNPDSLLVTLPVGWRPAAALGAVGGSGAGDGEVRIETDGTCYLRSFSNGNTINNTNYVRFGTMYLLP